MISHPQAAPDGLPGTAPNDPSDPPGLPSRRCPVASSQPAWHAGVRRILVIKWSALGDVAMASAIMEDLRLAFPDASLDLNTLAPATALFANDARFRHLLVIDTRARTHRLRQAWRWLREVRAGRYDLVVDLQSSDHTRLLVALLPFVGSRIRHRLGWRGRFPYTLNAAHAAGMAHPAARMRALLASAGIESRTMQPALRVPEPLAQRVRKRLADHGLGAQQFGVFMPGSQAAGWLKRWGVEKFVHLGRLMLDHGVSRIVLLGARDEAVDCRRIARMIATSHPGRVVYLNGLHPLQIIEVGSRSLWLVANDTGIAHVAAACSRPLVVLCGPTDPRRVKPIGPHVHALQARGGCLNCYAKSCRLAAAPQCMARIVPDRVGRMLLDGFQDTSDVVVF